MTNIAKYKVGDTVEVVYRYYTYCGYGSKFVELNFKDKDFNGPFSNGTRATVFAVTGHQHYSNKILYAVRTADSRESLIDEKGIKLIKSNNMSELKITKEKVLAAAAKCSTAKETLQTLFPEAFEPVKEYCNFGNEFLLNRSSNDGKNPLAIADGIAPKGFEKKCLYITHGWDVEVTEYDGYKIIIPFKITQP